MQVLWSLISFFYGKKTLKENLQEDTGILRNTQGVKTQE